MDPVAAALAGFPQQVAQNPRGWGNGPPGPPQPPWQQEPWAYQGEIKNSPERPQEYTAPLAEMTPPPIPGAAAIGKALPPVVGALVGGLGLNAMVGSTSEADESPMSQLQQQKAVLMQQRQDAYGRREQNRPRSGHPRQGVDVNYFGADQELRKLDAQLQAVDAMIADTAHKNDPAYQLELQQKASDLAAEQKAKEAATPFRERYPEIAGNLPLVGLGLAAGAPFALRGKANMGSWFPGSYAGRVGAGIKRAEGAMATGNRSDMDLAARELENLVAAQPTKTGSLLKAGAAAGSGGFLSAEAYMFPDQYDAFNLPPGENQEKARERALSVVPYAERGVVGALTGFSGYKLGDLVPSRSANIPRAEALRDHLRGRAGPTTGPSSPPGYGAPYATFNPPAGRMPAGYNETPWGVRGPRGRWSSDPNR